MLRAAETAAQQAPERWFGPRSGIPTRSSLKDRGEPSNRMAPASQTGKAGFNFIAPAGNGLILRRNHRDAHNLHAR